jgi:hypothetical protein
MLLNLSNHPKSTWDKKQTEIAEKIYGEIIDINFPAVDPEANEKEIYKIANEYLNHCKKLLSQSTDKNNAVHIMGEMTFSFSVVKLLKKNNIKCIASTSKRSVVQIENRKLIEFDFMQFREY